MQLLRALVLCTTCAACGGSLTEADKGTTYKSDFSVQFAENSVHQGTVRLNCTDTYNLVGSITVVIRQSNSTSVIGEGRIDARQNWLGVSGTGCTRGPDRSTGELTTSLTGTPAQLAFTIQRSGGTSFVVTSTYAFAGATSANGVNGTLTFTQAGRGITGGTVASTSDASASVNVTLR